MQGRRQGPGADTKYGPGHGGGVNCAVGLGLGLCGGRGRIFRAVTKKVAAAKAQIFQQGPLLRLVQTGQGTAQGRREHRPLPPVLQGRRQFFRRWPLGLVFFWRFGIGKKFQACAFAQIEQQPCEAGPGHGLCGRAVS